MTTRAEAHSANGTCFATRKCFVCAFFMKYLKVFVYIYIYIILCHIILYYIILYIILYYIILYYIILYYIIYVCMCNNVW